MRSIHVNSTKLAFVEKGSGPPVVSVHGSLGSYENWLGTVEALAQQHRVIAYSRRYHTPNAEPDDASDYSCQLHTADLIALIDSLRLAPVHLLGHSYGGALALLVARQQPEMVRTLLLLEPGVYSMVPATPEGQAVQKERARLMAPAGDLVKKGDDAALARLMINLVCRPGTFEELPADIQAGFLANARAGRAQALSTVPPPSFSCSDAATLRLPVLLVGGRTSPPEFGLILNELERCLPNAERVQVEAGHGLMLVNPDEVSRVLLAFLKKVENS